MNIAVIVTALGQHGTENWVELASIELVRRGHRVLVFAEHGPFDRADRMRAGGVDVRCSHAPPGIREYSEVLKAEKADLVHLHIWERSELLAHLGVEAGIPVLRSYHKALNHSLPGWLWRMLMLGLGPRFYREWSANRKLLDGHLGCCDASAESIRRIYGPAVNPRVYSLRNAVRTDGVTASADVLTGPPRFLQVGSLLRGKRPDLTLAAFQEVQRAYPDASLRFIGEGPLRSELEAFIQRWRIRAVSLEGVQSDLAPYYASSNILVLPSQSEGLPYSLIEAAAAGLALIATPKGGIPEVVRPGENGILVKPNSVRSLTAAMMRLASNVTLRATMGARGIQVVKKDFDLASHIDHLLLIYKKTVDHGSRSKLGV